MCCVCGVCVCVCSNLIKVVVSCHNASLAPAAVALTAVTLWYAMFKSVR